MVRDRSSAGQTPAAYSESDPPLSAGDHHDRNAVPRSVDELLGWTEFACWTALVLAPFLYWVNGSSVSTDQLVTRTVLVILSAGGAVGLRLYAWFRRR